AARPLRAASASAVSFTTGATIPLLLIWVSAVDHLAPTVAAGSLVALALLGAVAARVGGANVLKGAARIFVWGAIAMTLTAAVGTAFGTIVGSTDGRRAPRVRRFAGAPAVPRFAQAPIEPQVQVGTGDPGVLECRARLVRDLEMRGEPLAVQEAQAEAPRHRGNVENVVIVEIVAAAADGSHEVVEEGGVELGVVSDHDNPLPARMTAMEREQAFGGVRRS